MDLYNRWFCQSAANRCAKALLRCLPILLSSFVASALSFGLTRKSDEHTAVYAVAGFKSRRRSGCVHVDLYFDILYPFFSRGASCDGAIGEFLAGAIIPLPFFPQPFRQIAELLPFAAMQNVPLRIYSGDLVAHALWQMLGMQLFWLVVLVAGGKFWMARALKRVIVQGLKMSLYWKYFSIHLKSQMQYKVSFFLTALGQFLGSFTAFLGILFMFSQFHQVDGFSFEEVLLCFATVLFLFISGMFCPRFRPIPANDRQWRI